MDPRGNQPGDVGDVGHHQGPHLVGDLTEPLEVDRPRVGRVPAQQHLGFVFEAHFADRVVIDPFEIRTARVVDQWVVDRVEPLAAHVDLAAVR